MPQLQRPFVSTLALAVAVLCTGAAHAQTTTLGTRGLTSQPNPAITSNADATWQTYSRAERYAGAKTLPLQFITLSNGKKLGVFVSVPANAFGTAASGKSTRSPAIASCPLLRPARPRSRAEDAEEALRHHVLRSIEHVLVCRSARGGGAHASQHSPDR